MYLYCQFARHSAVETFYLISCELFWGEDPFFAPSHTSHGFFFAMEINHLFQGSQRYLNRRSGPRIKISWKALN